MSQPTYDYLVPTAKSVLGVPGEASLSDCKQAFLWRLEEEELILSADIIEAASLLGVLQTNGESYPILRSRFEHQFNQNLNEFLSEYWNIRPESRRLEWERLNIQAEALPRQSFRLSELKPGLDAEIPADEEGEFEFIIRCLSVAYLAPATMRRHLVWQIAAEADSRLNSQNLLASTYGVEAPEMKPISEANDTRLQALQSLAAEFLSRYPEFNSVMMILGIGHDAKALNTRQKSDDSRHKFKSNLSVTNSYTWSADKSSKSKNRYWWIVLIVVVIFLRLLLSRESNVRPTMPDNTFDPKTFGTTNFPKMPMFKINDKERIPNPNDNSKNTN